MSAPPAKADAPATAPAKTAAAKTGAAKATKPPAARPAARPSPAAAKSRKADAKAEKPAAKPPAQRAGRPAPKSAAKTKVAAPKAASADDLKQIKGVGPKLEATLHGLGVTAFSQIAAWTPADVAKFDDALKFSGRIERDDWIGQAKTLAAGGKTEFSTRVKKGDVY
jgi:NADH-quinone oxidoreductase subunit E